MFYLDLSKKLRSILEPLFLFQVLILYQNMVWIAGRWYKVLGELQGPMNYKLHIELVEILILGYQQGDVFGIKECIWYLCRTDPIWLAFSWPRNGCTWIRIHEIPRNTSASGWVSSDHAFWYNDKNFKFGGRTKTTFLLTA